MAPGWKPLREEISRRLWHTGAKVQPDEIVITNGATEALYLSIRHFCRPGDTVAVESPTFFSFLQMLEAQGLKVLEIPSDPDTGLSLDVLKYAMEGNEVRAVILIPTFSNPLGSLMPNDKKKSLVGFLEEKGVTLIEDDTYGDLAYDHTRPQTCLSFSKRVVSFFAVLFLKHCPPDWVGWFASPKHHGALEVLKTHANLGSATANQIVVTEILVNGGYDRHLKRLCDVTSRYMAGMKECVFQNFPVGTRMSRPKGGYVLWIELPKEHDAEVLYHKASVEGILFPPGSAFTTDRFKNCLRLNAGTWGEETKEGVERLGGLLHQQISSLNSYTT